jgi:hypothetical protein
VYLALDLPADNPFWTARENEGQWDKLGKGQKTIVLNGPGLALTMHGYSGTAELRPGKVNSGKSNPNYTRLAYNSEFPWEADSPQGATAGTYCVKQLGTDLDFMANSTLRFAGVIDGVLYRQTDLPGWLARVDLADIIVPGGVLRVDRLSIPFGHELHLAHYALPHIAGQEAIINTFEKNGHPVIAAETDLRRVAMVAYHGWDGLASATHRDLNAEAEESTVIYAHRRREKHYSGMDLAVTLLMHNPNPEPWLDDDLDPVAEMELLPWAPSGHPCGLRLALKDGREFTVDFGDVMGRIQT